MRTWWAAVAGLELQPHDIVTDCVSPSVVPVAFIGAQLVDPVAPPVIELESGVPLQSAVEYWLTAQPQPRDAVSDTSLKRKP